MVPNRAFPDLERVREVVDSVLGRERFELELSPLLPEGWPRPTAAVVWGYASEALPTGVAADRIEGPKVKVAIDGSSARVVVDKLALSDAKGSRIAPIEPEADLFRAQEALLRVLSGKSTPEAESEPLLAYARWARGERLLGGDARKRSPAFFAWLDALETRLVR